MGVSSYILSGRIDAAVAANAKRDCKHTQIRIDRRVVHMFHAV